MAKRIAIACAIAVVVLFGVGAWYVNDYYHADDAALAVVADEDGDADGIVVRELSDKAIAFVPENPAAGFIFYPGAKVQPEAYAPLLEQCAERGVACVLVRPLFNLAILDENAADGIAAQFPDIGTWAIGGHSMGGVAAADYTAQHADAFSCVAFFASYPNTDLSSFSDTTLSIAGANDAVLNREKYDEAFAHLPESAVAEEIAGGNHAYFGNYGEQAGDGRAAISREEQQRQAADALAGAITSAGNAA